MGGDVGALGLARAGGPLVAELAHEPQPPRREHERDAAEHHDRRDDRLRERRGLDALPDASPISRSTPTPASRMPPATRSTLTGVRPPARSRSRSALRGVELAPRQPEPGQHDERRQQPVDLHVGARAHRDQQRRPRSRARAPMAMSVTGIRRPGSTMFCRRASRVSVLGRTSCAASAGIADGDREPPERRRAAARRPPSGRQDEEREPHQADRQVEVRGEAERDAAEPAPARGAAQREPSRRDEGFGGGARSDRHTPDAPPGVHLGAASGLRARRIRVLSGGHPMPRARRDDQDRDMDTSTPPAPERTGSPAAAARTRPTASSPRSAASASRVPTTAGSPASAPASPTGSASTRCWSAASSPRPCCSAASASSSTASPGPCCPSGATAGSTSRR